MRNLKIVKTNVDLKKFIDEIFTDEIGGMDPKELADDSPSNNPLIKAFESSRTQSKGSGILYEDIVELAVKKQVSKDMIILDDKEYEYLYIYLEDYWDSKFDNAYLFDTVGHYPIPTDMLDEIIETIDKEKDLNTYAIFNSIKLEKEDQDLESDSWNYYLTWDDFDYDYCPDLVRYAKSELEILDPKNLQWWINEHVLDAVKIFADKDYSNVTSMWVSGATYRLLMQLPLTSLTGEDDEWSDEFGGDLLRNKRCPTVFKDVLTGSTYNSIGVVFSEDSGKTWHVTRDSSIPITFPYFPPLEPEKKLLEPKESEKE